MARRIAVKRCFNPFGEKAGLLFLKHTPEQQNDLNLSMISMVCAAEIWTLSPAANR
jgi:hypothetical protein